MRRRWPETIEAADRRGAIRANKARGVLTTLGIVIGIVAVVTTMTAANGLANRFRESFSALGTDVLYVSRMPWIIDGDFFQFRNRPHVDLREAAPLEQPAAARRRRQPDHAAPSAASSSRSRPMDNVDVIGTTDKQVLVSSALPEPRPLPHRRSTSQAKRRVCVIGTDVHERPVRRASTRSTSSSRSAAPTSG